MKKRFDAGTEIEILPAQKSDASEILSLQKRAFQSEAKRYDNYEIAPLKQTLDEIVNDFIAYTFLKAMSGEKIVGAVKFRKIENKCWIGRVIVEPALQRKGIGTILLEKIEAIVPDAAEYFLFTGSDSPDNIAFYKKSGYVFNGSIVEENGVKLMGMSKCPS
jgi:GNAT superfamily N-acetyltransferase